MKKVISIHRGPPAHWVGNGFHVRSLFVMNTHDEIHQAVRDFQSGRLERASAAR